MATRSVAAYRREDGTVRGTYVHWDGHPEHALPELEKRFDLVGYNGMVEWIEKGIEGNGYRAYDYDEPFYDSDLPLEQEIDDQEYGYLITEDGPRLEFSLY